MNIEADLEIVTINSSVFGVVSARSSYCDLFKMNDLKDVEALKKVILGGFDYEEAMKDHGIDQKDVDDLRERLVSSKVVPKGFYDKALFLSLVVCDNNIEKCKIFVEHFFKLIMDSLEFFHDRDPKSAEIQSCLDNQFYICLPPTPDNCNLIYFKLSNSDPKNYVFDDAEKTLFMFVGKYICNTCIANQLSSTLKRS